MGDFFKSFRFKVLLCLCALIVGVTIYTVTRGGYSSGSSSFFGTMFAPLQRLSESISESVTSSLDSVVNADRYYRENQKLKEELGKCYNELIDYDNIKRENEEFRKMLELKEKYPDYVFSSPCCIIARTTNDPYGAFTIDKGSDDGIAPNDPVVTSVGLVGICSEVSPRNSRVRTIFSPENPVGVMCVRTKDTGVLEGSYELAEKGLCRMSYIDKNSDMKVGDLVVTSGNSGIFPIDQLVGTVEEVEMEESGLSKYAIVRPVIAPGETVNVFVITSFNGQGEGYE